EVRGARVAQDVRCEAIADPGRVAHSADDHPDALAAEPAASLVEKHRLLVAAPTPPSRDHDPTPVDVDPLVERRSGGPEYRHDPFLVPLADDPQVAVVQVDV